jgi:saccharopine dehydrogenase (NAD+, L-lysine-forming)
MVGAKMMLTGKWRATGVVNMEQLPPEPFLEALAEHGLPWHVVEL